MHSINTSQQRQVRFSDYLPVGESRKGIGVFLRAARKGGDADDVVARVQAWVRTDTEKARETNHSDEIFRLERLGNAIKEHPESALNLAAWAVRQMEAPA